MVKFFFLHTSQAANMTGAYPGYFSMRRLGIFIFPPVWDAIKVADIHLYTWVERGTLRIKCLAQEHNTMSSARPRTQNARWSGNEHTNYEATAHLRSGNMPCLICIIWNTIPDDSDLYRIHQLSLYNSLKRVGKGIAVSQWNSIWIWMWRENENGIGQFRYIKIRP